MKLIKLSLLALMAAVAFGVLAKDSGEDRGRPVLPTQVNVKWQQECASCHMAFPPGLLPVASWEKLMGGLDQHFGTDASLSPKDASEIGSFLKQNASNRWRAITAPLRITDSFWFKRKHHEVANAVWQRASIKSPSNCMACHAGADKGNFNEHSVRIPR